MTWKAMTDPFGFPIAWTCNAGPLEISVYQNPDCMSDIVWLLSFGDTFAHELQEKGSQKARAEALKIVHEWALKVATATKTPESKRGKTHGKG